MNPPKASRSARGPNRGQSTGRVPTSGPRTGQSTRWWSAQAFREVVPAWLAARILVLLAFAAAQAIAANLRSGVGLLHLDGGLFTWDGAWYLNIARDGYEGVPTSGVRFFPLYPLLSRWVGAAAGGWDEAGLLVVSNGCALLAALLLRHLVITEFGDRALAQRSVWLLAVAPSAFVFAFGYGESLMLVLALAYFLLIRRGDWWWAAAIGLLAGLSRPTAALLAAGGLIEASRGLRSTRWGERFARLASLAAPAAGLGAYLLYVEVKFGDGFLPARLQSDLRTAFQDPVTRVLEGIWRTLFESQADAPNVAFALLFIGLAVVCARTLPASYTAYVVVSLVVALSAENINSIGRYGLVLFPLTIALAHLCADERAYRGTLVVASGAMVALTTMTWIAGYIP